MRGVDGQNKKAQLNPQDVGTKPEPKGLMVALELMELGIALARQRISRLNPGASPEVIQDKVNEWICTPRSGPSDEVFK